MIKSLAAKDYYLIQGPPGTGKSFVLGLIIHEEVVKRRHKVIVTGPNHLAVNNALIKALELYPQGRYIKVGQKYNEVTTKVRSQDKEYGVENLSYADVKSSTAVCCRGSRVLRLMLSIRAEPAGCTATRLSLMKPDRCLCRSLSWL